MLPFVRACVGFAFKIHVCCWRLISVQGNRRNNLDEVLLFPPSEKTTVFFFLPLPISIIQVSVFGEGGNETVDVHNQHIRTYITTPIQQQKRKRRRKAWCGFLGIN